VSLNGRIRRTSNNPSNVEQPLLTDAQTLHSALSSVCITERLSFGASVVISDDAVGRSDTLEAFVTVDNGFILFSIFDSTNRKGKVSASLIHAGSISCVKAVNLPMERSLVSVFV
jgi:hypothetical protein